MMVIHVWVRAKAGEQERLETRLREIVADARALPGCTRYEWYRSPTDERDAFVIGAFESDESFARYRESSVVKRIVDQVVPLLEWRPAFEHLRATVFQQG